MEAKQNDVLSGRGACFNYHPGNKKFRTILETYMDAYTTGTKKRKMMISKAIVEAIYSMQPPGRFLKKCTDTGQWRELTRREAADKAAQAMAYAVRTSRKAAKKQSSIPLVTTTSQPPPPPFIGDGLAGGSSSPKTKAHHVPTANLASDWGTKWDTTDASSGAVHDNDGGREELVSRNSSHQQQLLRFQQTSRSATLPTTSAGAPTNRLAQMQMIARTQQEQQYYQQRQLSLQYLMSQQPSLGFHNGLPYRSHPSSQPLSAPSSSAQGMSLPPNNFLRQEYLSRGNYGADAQLSALLQRERNMLPNPNPTMHSMMGYQQSIFGTDIAPSYEAQQMQQMQRLRAMMQHQLSSLTDTSVECIPSRRQSSQSLDLLQQAAYLQQKSPQDLPPPPVINSTSRAELSAQSTASSTPQTQQGGDGKLKDTEDDQ